MPTDTIAEKLRKFYCEARPKKWEKKGKDNKIHNTEYNRLTLKNARAAINRHLQELEKPINIVLDKEFMLANLALEGTLKVRTKSEKPRLGPKTVISMADLTKISSYLTNGSFKSPLVLRQAVWFNISLSFVGRGREIHHELLRDSFVIKTDESGIEYATLTPDAVKRNFPEGLYGDRAETGLRMYAAPKSPSCPVKILRFYLDKLDPHSKHFFNHCVKQAVLCPTTTKYWYNHLSLAQHSINKLMEDISEGAGCDKKYTPKCLRNTARERIMDANLEHRRITQNKDPLF